PSRSILPGRSLYGGDARAGRNGAARFELERRADYPRTVLVLRIAAYKAGTASSVTGVESDSAQIAESARGCCSSAPDPRPRASGSRPNSVQNVVIRMGRRRMRP